ncbi:hypothetical protein [Hymenobacter jejuensis]|uniref:Uncharacterized protein n=1 Tax=Hymenobacter jejuensis TaxID=2502781 RepID=A0A5B8A4F4_9BACT|nr:hypothetical protein [Hymenobacter jejuensis]QDA62284.1 hypothetical protein FHG12_20240 [Hymenobacter jejuensis]
MRHFVATLVTSAVCTGLLLGGLVACSPEGESRKPPAKAVATSDRLRHLDEYFNSLWAMNKLWEDGLAEVAIYDAERVIYNKQRRFEYVLITVKEEFNQQFNVKTDDYKRKDVFPVMKVNQFCRIPTEQYPYHFLTSLFFRRDQPVPLYKLTTSSQEWCGNTFKAISDDGMEYIQTYNSYWDGQGAGERHLRHDVLFEDALPYTLRSLKFDTKPSFRVEICDLQQTSQAKPPVYYAAQVQVAEAPSADAPEPAWRVQLQLDKQKQNVYWFAKKYPNTLLRQTTWDGRNLQLKSLRRYAYWVH